MRKNILLVLILIFSFTAMHAANEIPPRPEPPRLVNDLAGMLNEQEEQALETKLLNYSDSTSTQIAVVTIETLDGYDIADFANRLAESWGVGQKGKDNGLVILLAKQEHKARVEVGYGLEGAIPDAIAKRIVDDVMIPEFKQGNFYGGIDKGTDVIISKAFGEFKGEKKKKKGSGSIWIALAILVGIIFIINKFKGPGGGNISRRGYHGGGILGGGFGGGGFGGLGGGSSGGGFGGFGGGGFGGGGASGEW